MTTYAATYQRSQQDPGQFWLDAAQDIEWTVPPTAAIDESKAPMYSWFPGAELNVAANALDRHVAAGRADQAALIYDSAVLGTVKTYSYKKLLSDVEKAAGALAELGVVRGDRVIIYMPMIPEALISMLACARLGAVHSVVFGGFAPKELAARIDDATPKVIVTATGGIEPARRVEYLPNVAQAIATSAHKVSYVVVKAREGFQHSPENIDQAGAQWIDYDGATQAAVPHAAVPVLATDPLYILYTSGTTGKPKGVVRDSGGYAVAMQWSMKNIYGVGPGETMFTASDVGWVVGHSYIVYAPLIAGATTVLYEGKPVGTPDAGAFWRVVAQHGAKVLFTAPTALRAIRKNDPHGEFIKSTPMPTLKALFAAGERLDPDTSRWIEDALAVPVIDNWWQTETGWPIASNPFGLEELPRKIGSPTFAVPGYDVRILDAFGEELTEPNTEGNIAIKLPMPPGTLATLWGSNERYKSSYLDAFPGYYATGDSGFKDDENYLFVMGRTDDVINVSGHRLSTGAMEQVVASHPAIAECAVIGVADPLKGQRPSGYVVLKSGVDIAEEDLRKELIALVRQDIGPVADFKDVAVVAALPKTRSGKILRKTMRQIADGEEYVVPSTIEDASVIDDLLDVLRG